MLVAPKEKESHCRFDLKVFEDNVYEPLLANANNLGEAIAKVMEHVTHVSQTPAADDIRAKSGYEPTPTIIEAATLKALLLSRE